jgi:hypothetical protein
MPVPYGSPCWANSHVPTAASMRATGPWASGVIPCGVCCVVANSITSSTEANTLGDAVRLWRAPASLSDAMSGRPLGFTTAR